ncbi:Lrp/AsnC family transcriptional regulator [Alginatibacterium sediminis]|uniref:Lrp/AsnC family transcriptional regulator n=1 Tax=Alginatibacterium sediminis TaxID=2164068 RepID=A0A420EH50_9ALTE|nr:Lrp/AsnC family transcriptional regulator [Alginatibacterium sediminis]RKF20019.1 Lrp/AsnC family transcriptional regulator [Alginatibacterium sediminis]
MTKLDKTNRHLLELIQKDARLSTHELADLVGLSASPVARRLRQLEDDGLIEGYRAHLNQRKLGLHITTFVHVRLKDHQEASVLAFEQSVREMSAVLNCHTVSGAYDYLLQVVSQDLVDYEQWVRSLQRLPLVSHIDSSFAIRGVKTNDFLPIP